MSADIRERLCRWGRSLFERGLTGGSSGNITVRTEAGFLATPTNSCLGFLDPAALSELDAAGNHVGGPKPTKEVPLHMAFYAARPGRGRSCTCTRPMRRCSPASPTPTRTTRCRRSRPTW